MSLLTVAALEAKYADSNFDLFEAFPAFKEVLFTNVFSWPQKSTTAIALVATPQCRHCKVCQSFNFNNTVELLLIHQL